MMEVWRLPRHTHLFYVYPVRLEIMYYSPLLAVDYDHCGARSRVVNLSTLFQIFLYFSIFFNIYIYDLL